MENTYTVQQGDNLSTIAKKNNTTVDELVKLNDIKNINLIKVGQVLKINDNSSESDSNQNVENKELSEFNDIEKRENELNKKARSFESVPEGNIWLINEWHRLYRPEEYYTIDDKNSNKFYICKGGDIVKEFSAIHGKNALLGDFVTTTRVINGVLSNGAGNLCVPAGLYFLKKSGGYKKAPSFIRQTKEQREQGLSDGIPNAIHVGHFTENDAKFRTVNSNGCTRLNAEALSELNKCFKDGMRCYMIPCDKENQFYIRNGDIQFKSGATEKGKRIVIDENGTKTEEPVTEDKPAGVYVKNLKGEFVLASKDNQLTNPNYTTFNYDEIEDISFDDDGLKINKQQKDVIDKYLEGLKLCKKYIQKKTGINNDTYNKLSRIAVGILGVESTFGKKKGPVSNFLRMFGLGRPDPYAKYEAEKAALSSKPFLERISKYYDYASMTPDFNYNDKSLDKFFKSTADYLLEKFDVPMNKRSIGYTQFRYITPTNDDYREISEETDRKIKNILDDLNIKEEDLVYDPSKSAVATMIKLALNYKQSGMSWDDNKVIGLWHHNRKDTQNKYAENVKNYAKRVHIMQYYKDGGLLRFYIKNFISNIY